LFRSQKKEFHKHNLASTNISNIKQGLMKKPEIMHESSKLADQKKQDKLQWLQEPSQIKGPNLHTLR